MKNYVFASMMVCDEPTVLKNRYMLSAYPGVWQPALSIDEELRTHFTDEIGNDDPHDFGAVQPKAPSAFYHVEKSCLHSCLRFVRKSQLSLTDTVPPTWLREAEEYGFVFAGWDVCCGNGWMSASCENAFPIDPFTGNIIDGKNNIVNAFGLIENIEDCMDFCQINNSSASESGPWYSVGVYITVKFMERLRAD